MSVNIVIDKDGIRKCEISVPYEAWAAVNTLQADPVNDRCIINAPSISPELSLPKWTGTWDDKQGAWIGGGWVEGDPAVALAKTQNVVWEQIKSKREQVKLGGFHEPVSGKWFHSDDRSRSQHLGLTLAAASGSIPAGVMWKTLDGSFIEMTAALAADILTAAMTLDTAAHAVAEQHKAAMLASADPGAYDFSTSWPQTYADMLP